MAAVATGRAGTGWVATGSAITGSAITGSDSASDDGAASDADGLVECAVTTGTMVTFTDTATTQGCPGRPESEGALLDAALGWLRARARGRGCAAMQIGFDPGGRPRLAVALSDPDGPARRPPPRRSSDGAVAIESLPCTLVTFTDCSHGSTAERDALALVRAMRRWVRAHPDFSCDAVQTTRDLEGRAQLVLVGEGWGLD